MTAQPIIATDRDGQPVLAAVHLDSRYFDDVIARATARALHTNGELIAFSVITRSSIGHALTRLNQRLRRCRVPVQLIATRVTPDLTSSEQLAAVGSHIINAAAQLGAQAVVLGHAPAATTSKRSVRGVVTTGLSPGIDLCFGTAGMAELADTTPFQDGISQASDLSTIHLTDEGRQAIAARAIAIDRRRLPQARRRLQAQPESAQNILDYEHQVNELRRLLHLVETAPSTAELPDDPDRVDLGEHVELALERGTRRRVTVVDPIEVTRGRSCVASTSGLGRALLGRQVGDWTAIPTPRGPRQAQILSATR
jgi:transcription elongation GreA/GreB family factor